MKKYLWSAIAAVLLLLTWAGAVRGEGPYIYAATHSARTVDVRLDAPDGGLLMLGVYHRATHQMTGMETEPVPAAASTQIVTVTFDTAPASTEYVRAFLVDQDTLAPLCIPVLADYVIPGPGGDPSDPDPDPEPEPDPDPEPTPGSTVYVLNTNSHIFHYPSCSAVKRMSEKNKQSFEGPRDAAIAMGYTPCKICSP